MDDDSTKARGVPSGVRVRDVDAVAGYGCCAVAGRRECDRLKVKAAIGRTREGSVAAPRNTGIEGIADARFRRRRRGSLFKRTFVFTGGEIVGEF